MRAAAAVVHDWERFDALVRRNRINPLVHHALSRAGVRLPAVYAEGLAVRSHAASRRALELARTSVRLQRAFEGEGIASMIIKGTPLAVLAYGELGLKESMDVDLLVRAEDVLRARDLLLRYGGRMTPPMTDREFKRFVEYDKEALFYLDDAQITVELHWRLVTHRSFLRGVGAGDPGQFVTLPGGTLRTLADEPLFAFLCLHGALHNWSRLKWLADVGAFLGNRSVEQVEQLYEAAQTLGGGRSAAVAMLLCRQLFGLPMAPQLLASLRQNSIVGVLANNVVAALSYRQGAAEHESYSVPWLRMKAAQFFLAPGASHVMDHARVVWISPTDRTRISLPPRLDFVYHLLRIPLWIGRTCRRLAKATFSRTTQLLT